MKLQRIAKGQNDWDEPINENTEEIEKAINELQPFKTDAEKTLQTMQSISFEIGVEDWKEDVTQEGYNYRADVSASGVMPGDVVVAPFYAESLTAAQEAGINLAKEMTNKIRFYAKKVPNVNLSGAYFYTKRKEQS